MNSSVIAFAFNKAPLVGAESPEPREAVSAVSGGERTVKAKTAGVVSRLPVESVAVTLSVNSAVPLPRADVPGVTISKGLSQGLEANPPVGPASSQV